MESDLKKQLGFVFPLYPCVSKIENPANRLQLIESPGATTKCIQKLEDKLENKPLVYFLCVAGAYFAFLASDFC